MNDKQMDALMAGVMAQVDQETRKNSAEKGQLTLGELAILLASLPTDAEIEFDDGRRPGSYDSYRGYYNYISLEPDGEEPTTVGGLLAATTAAIGATFEGYKGGDFCMDKYTPVWVSDWGTASGDGVVAVEMHEGKATLRVAHVEEW